MDRGLAGARVMRFLQRIVLILYATTVLTLLMNPPFYYDVRSSLSGAGHNSIFDPPQIGDFTALVAWGTLAVYLAGVTLAAAALWLSLMKKPTPKGDKE